MSPSSRTSLFILTLFALCGTSSWAGTPSQGLWVGEVALNAVNEATGAVGNSNTYEFSDPEVPTPTSDTAFLRVILHVNGAGQVRLLKSVAIVEGGVLPDGSQDLLLLTDPSLYPQYPGIAKRIATAFFDFGDQRAVTVVQDLIDTATATAVTEARSGKTKAQIETEVLTDLGEVKTNANLDAAYLDRGTSGANSFLRAPAFFTAQEVQDIADKVALLIHDGTKPASKFYYDSSKGTYQSPFAADPVSGRFAALIPIAQALAYGDTRGIDAIAGIVAAAAEAVDATVAGANLATKQANARLAAEGAYHNAADLTQAYNKFISSSVFTASFPAETVTAAVQAALTAQGRGDSGADILIAVTDKLLTEATVSAAYTAAETIRTASLWGDLRARRAVDLLVNRVAASAAAQVLVSQDEATLKKTVEDAVAAALGDVKAAPVFSSAPSPAYSGFVTGSDYQAAVVNAAKTAAAEASFQFGAGVTNADQLTTKTKAAVTKALTSVRNQAALLPQDSLAMSGGLSAGNSLNGTLYLPALAPTNPFMHRQHPDHTEGYPVTRRISMTIDAADPGASGRSGYGVSRLSGTYLEEIFGLHKPLGNNLGLRTQGTFTLNRLSFVDSLNF